MSVEASIVNSKFSSLLAKRRTFTETEGEFYGVHLKAGRPGAGCDYSVDCANWLSLLDGGEVIVTSKLVEEPSDVKLVGK